MIRKLKRIRDKIEATAMAVAFAEAGEWKTATQLLDDWQSETASTNPKLLFAAADEGFSSSVIDYTVNLAARLKFDILALNFFQPGFGKTGLQNYSEKFSGKRFARSKEMQALLRERSQELGIHCEQALLKDDMRTTITKVHKLIRRIELVIIQRNQNGDPYLNLGIPVYLVSPKKG
ncbi:MAG: hypothetical protein ABIK68_04550 [bacterium]